MSLRVRQRNHDIFERQRTNLFTSQLAANKADRDRLAYNHRIDRSFAESQQKQRSVTTPVSRSYGLSTAGYSAVPYKEGNAIDDWIAERVIGPVFDPPDEFLDVCPYVFKLFGVCFTLGTFGIVYPLLCVLNGRVTLTKSDKIGFYVFVRMTAFFWGMFGVTKGIKKIVQLFEKYQKQRLSNTSI